jgi:hypothetical protein
MLMTISGLHRRLYILPFLLLFLFSACRKKEQLPENFITATANGTRFFASGKTVTTNRAVAGTSSPLEIQGVMASGSTMKLWIRNYTGTLVDLSMDSTDASGSYLAETPSVEYASVHGVLTIKTVTPTITGTFHFVCVDSTVVDGNFSALP